MKDTDNNKLSDIENRHHELTIQLLNLKPLLLISSKELEKQEIKAMEYELKLLKDFKTII